jgi:hypothetical protein
MPPKQKRKDHPSSASITSSSTTSSAKSARTAPELADDESMALDQQIAVAMDEIRSAAYRADVDDKKFWQGQLTALQALKTEKMKQKTLLRETNLAEMPPGALFFVQFALMIFDSITFSCHRAPESVCEARVECLKIY